MSIQERFSQYKAGLITREELQRFLDWDNMGSDTRYLTISDLEVMYS